LVKIQKGNSMVEEVRQLIVDGDMVAQPFPIFLKGEVVRGFGRGGKQLGIPTGK
jgi:FAD synthase